LLNSLASGHCLGLLNIYKIRIIAYLMNWRNEIPTVKILNFLENKSRFLFDFSPKIFFFLRKGGEKTKQWPLAPNSPKWQITCANVSRRVTFLLNTRQICRSECIESGLSRVANLANLANF
jgi:hypothetical protein